MAQERKPTFGTSWLPRWLVGAQKEERGPTHRSARRLSDRLMISRPAFADVATSAFWSDDCQLGTCGLIGSRLQDSA